MYKASAICDAASLSCSKVDDTETSIGTANARTINDDRLEGAEGKVDILTPDKTYKIPILISC